MCVVHSIITLLCLFSSCVSMYHCVICLVDYPFVTKYLLNWSTVICRFIKPSFYLLHAIQCHSDSEKGSVNRGSLFLWGTWSHLWYFQGSVFVMHSFLYCFFIIKILIMVRYLCLFISKNTHRCLLCDHIYTAVELCKGWPSLAAYLGRSMCFKQKENTLVYLFHVYVTYHIKYANCKHQICEYMYIWQPQIRACLKLTRRTTLFKQ